MSSVAQLNVRMNSELKAAGDSVLDLYGIAPSELIRALWLKISQGERSLDQVVRVLAANPAAGSVQTAGLGHDSSRIVQLVQQRQAALEHELGLDPATYIPLPDEQLEDLVYQDYLEKALAREAHHED